MRFIIRTVHNSFFPYSVTMEPDNFLETEIAGMYQWCEETFGNPATTGSTPTSEAWIRHYSGMRFKEKEHLDWFILRWA